MRKGKVQGYQTAHLLPQTQDVFVRDMLRAKLAIQAAGQGVVDFEDLIRKEVAYRPLGQETQGTEISTPAVNMVVTDEFYLMRIENLKIQILELVVHQSRQHGIFFLGPGVGNG